MTGGTGGQGGFPIRATPDTAIGGIACGSAGARRRGQNPVDPSSATTRGPGRCSWAGQRDSVRSRPLYPTFCRTIRYRFDSPSSPVRTSRVRRRRRGPIPHRGRIIRRNMDRQQGFIRASASSRNGGGFAPPDIRPTAPRVNRVRTSTPVAAQTSPFGPSPSDPTVPPRRAACPGTGSTPRRGPCRRTSRSSRPPRREGGGAGARGRRRGGGRAGRRWSRWGGGREPERRCAVGVDDCQQHCLAAT